MDLFGQMMYAPLQLSALLEQAARHLRQGGNRIPARRGRHSSP
ncbi:hypothetical protein ACU4GD_37220 [Cupriavidus basilensis]